MFYAPDGYGVEDPAGSGLYAFSEYTPPIDVDTASPDQVYAALGDLVFDGRPDEFGVVWSLQSFDGWGATSSTRQTVQRPRQSGGWSGDGYATGRSVALGGIVEAPDAAALRAALDRLNGACSLGDTRLVITEGTVSRWCTVHRSGAPLWNWLTPTIAQWSIQVASDDWRKFGEDVTGATYLPQSIGGFTFPLTFPLTIDATTVSGQVHLTNPGNEVGPVRLRIDGPVVGPVVTHIGSGQSLVFSSSLALGVGEYLDIDMEAHTVLANGQASRSGWVTSRGWFSFEPGENTFAFTAAQFNAGAQLTVTATPSYQ